MKVITLHQPWATLIALGVKTIETRSWAPPKALIGERLLIHAGTRPLPVGGVNCPPTPKRDGTSAERDAVNHQTWHAINTITDPEFQGPQPCNPKTGRQRRIPKRAQTPTLFWPHAGPWHRPREGKPEFTHTEYLPLGAIVVSCILADAVPMVDALDLPWPHGPHLRIYPDGNLYVERPGRRSLDVADQSPYGDFAPGRRALLLEDVKPTTDRCPACWGTGDRPTSGGVDCMTCGGSGECGPIPAKGHQRVWNWEPAA